VFTLKEREEKTDKVSEEQYQEIGVSGGVCRKDLEIGA
jgi:hypothetical protein